MSATDSTFDNHGIQFHIPTGWEVTEQPGHDNDTTITLSDGAAFWSITLMWERPEIDRVLREAKTAFEEEYENADAVEVESQIAGREATGFDIHFVCLELVNSVHLRCVRTGRFTVFIMYQMTDHESEFYRPIFNEMTESLNLDNDGDVIIV